MRHWSPSVKRRCSKRKSPSVTERGPSERGQSLPVNLAAARRTTGGVASFVVKRRSLRTKLLPNVRWFLMRKIDIESLLLDHLSKSPWCIWRQRVQHNLSITRQNPFSKSYNIRFVEIIVLWRRIAPTSPVWHRSKSGCFTKNYRI